MSHKDLFQYAVNARKGKGPRIYAYCFIQDATGLGGACNYYAQGEPDMVEPGYDGVPKGTGCIVGPGSWGGICWYENSSYLTAEERKSMCTDDCIANGAAQICWAIKKSCCHRDGIPSLSYPEGFLSMSDEDLFQYTVDASEDKVPKIGKYCWITDRHEKGGACNFYAKAHPDAIDVSLDGTPAGTGCINERGSTFCWYANLAHLTVEERASMCTDDYIANGAAQICWAIQNGLCDEAPDFMSMSDKDLFQYMVNAGTGEGPHIYAYCFIQDATGLRGACNYYAKGEPDAVEPGYDGVPEGTGCIAGPGSWGGSCWYKNSSYLTAEERKSMCTDDYIANGAAQIHWAIKKGCCHREGIPSLSYCEGFLSMSDKAKKYVIM
jgi:hypothetical protein